MQEKIGLEELQDRVYRIFVDFDRICRKYNIRYSMEGGTLLGAVKYQNFVPWDDDIDVIMLRDEYEKFLSVAPGELADGFFLQSYNNVRQFPLNYAKLCDTSTEIYDYDYSHLKEMNHGIFIDIFPIDNVVPSKLKNQLHLVGLLTGARKTKLKIDFGKVSSLRRILYKGISMFPMKWLCSWQNAACKKYNRKKTSHRYEVCNSNRKFAPMPSEIYDSVVELPFRDKTFFAVSDYDIFLQSRFGNNYMNELPPIEERKPSHNQNIRIKSGKAL